MFGFGRFIFLMFFFLWCIFFCYKTSDDSETSCLECSFFHVYLQLHWMLTLSQIAAKILMSIDAILHRNSSDVYFRFLVLCRCMTRRTARDMHILYSSIHNNFDRLFGKHLSVLNFIRQANNCMSDYWIEQLIHLHIHSHISQHTQTPEAYVWMHTYTIHIAISLELYTTLRSGSMRKPNCLANSNSILQ